MTEIIIDARVNHQETIYKIENDEIVPAGEKVWLELKPVQPDGLPVEMTALLDSSLEELATMALAQEFTPVPDQAYQRRFTIQAHQVDNEWIVDSVVETQLPNESARDGYANLPGWADWTATEAAQWITDNVTDLASAKTALIAMAQAITFLRDWRKSP